MLTNEQFFSDLDGIKLQNGEIEFLTEQGDSTKTVEPSEYDPNFNLETESEEEITENAFFESEPQEQELERPSISKKAEAKGYVSLLDVCNKVVLPKFAKKKFFSKEEVAQLNVLEKNEKAGVNCLNIEDIALKNKEADFLNWCNSLPLSDDEKTELTNALETCLIVWDTKPNPTITLVLVLVMIEGLRLVPLFTGDFK